MARSTFLRSAERHEATAAEILRRHATHSGSTVALPVPIEMIIEQTYGLRIVYDTIAEPGGMMILGALAPTRREIVINTAHQDLLDNVIGPERFTYAHELGHWVYDADDPNQLSLTIDGAAETFCYHREAPDLPETVRIREINANKLAAALLLPAALVREAEIGDDEPSIRETARAWGVSFQTLSIRLQELGLTR